MSISGSTGKKQITELLIISKVLTDNILSINCSVNDSSVNKSISYHGTNTDSMALIRSTIIISIL